MLREITLYDRVIQYSIRKSTRAKRLRIAVYSNCDVVVTLPYGKTTEDVESYVSKKARWISGKVDYFRKAKGLRLQNRPSGFENNMTEAYELAERILKKFNKIYGFQYKKITIKDHKTKWGSCSKGGSLNFNYRLVFLPRALAEYVVVHELCHLKEMGHSRKYWNLVEKGLPDYVGRMRRLKQYAMV